MAQSALDEARNMFSGLTQGVGSAFSGIGNAINQNVIQPIQQGIQNYAQQNPDQAQQFIDASKITNYPQQVGQSFQSSFVQPVVSAFNQNIYNPQVGLAPNSPLRMFQPSSPFYQEPIYTYDPTQNAYIRDDQALERNTKRLSPLVMGISGEDISNEGGIRNVEKVGSYPVGRYPEQLPGPFDKTISKFQDSLAEATKDITQRPQPQFETPPIPDSVFGKKPITLGQPPEGGMNVLDQAQQSLALPDQYRLALENKPQLDQIVSNAAEDVQGRMITNLKNPESAIKKVGQKIEEGRSSYDVGDINDLSRGRIMVNTESQVYKAVDSVTQEIQNAGANIVKEEDFFKHPQDGYEGYHIDVKFPNGQVGEIQIHTEKSVAKSEATHTYHSVYGDQEEPDQVDANKKAIMDKVDNMSTPKAEALAKNIEAYNESLPNAMPQTKADFGGKLSETGVKNFVLHPEMEDYVRGSLEAKQQAGLPIPKGVNEIAGMNAQGLAPIDIPPLSAGGFGGERNIPLPGAGVPVKQPSPLQALLNYINPLKGERDILAKSKDPNARLLLQRIDDYRNNFEDMASPALTQLENARKQLKPQEYENAVDVAEGRAKPMSPAVQNWADIWKVIANDIAGKAKALNLKALDPQGSGFLVDWAARDNYFPHFTTPEVLKDIQANPNKYIDNLIKSGKASSPFEARLYLSQFYDELKARRYGNLEMHRLDLDLPYIKDPSLAEKYVVGAYNRIAQANQFGVYTQDAQNIINNIIGSGNKYDAGVAKSLLSKVIGKSNQSLESQGLTQLGSAVRTVESILKLPLISLHHAGQYASIAARGGIFNAIAETPGLFKSLLLNEQSPVAKNAVLEVHDYLNNYDPYGKGGSINSSFLQAVGFNRVIKSLRSFGAAVADRQVNSFNLNDPTAQRLLDRAGLNVKDIQTRGSLTQAEKNQYIRSALNDTALLFQPGQFSQLNNTPLGKMVMMFKSFGVAQAQRTIPFLLSEFKNGNFSPLVIFLALGTIIGTGEQIVQNIIQNKPAPSTQRLLTQGALRGANPGIIGQTLADLLMYPQYAGSYLTGLAGGPIASDIANISGAIKNITNPANPNDQLAGKRELARNIPLVGPAVANTAFPYKSYVGNRPWDIIGKMTSGQNVSPLDLVRQNPQVAQQQQKSGQYNVRSSISDPNKQKIFDFLLTPSSKGGPGLEQKADTIMKNQWVIPMLQKIQTAHNPNDPLWSRTPSDILAFMAWKSEDKSAVKNEIVAKNPWIPQVQTQIAQQAAQATGQSYKPTLLSQFSPEQVKIISTYGTLPLFSPQRKQLEAQYPFIKQYKEAQQQEMQQNPYQDNSPLGQYLKDQGINANPPLFNPSRGIGRVSSSSGGGGGGGGYNPMSSMGRKFAPRMNRVRASRASAPKVRALSANRIGRIKMPKLTMKRNSIINSKSLKV